MALGNVSNIWSLELQYGKPESGKKSGRHRRFERAVSDSARLRWQDSSVVSPRVVGLLSARSLVDRLRCLQTQG
jgi:hypothetical protein